MGFTAVAREKLHLATPIPMDVDPMDLIVSTSDSQSSALLAISTNNPEDASQTQIKSHPSDNTSAATTAKTLIVQTVFDAVHEALHSDLPSPRGVRTPQTIGSLDGSAHKNERPVDTQNAGFLSMTLGESFFIA